MMKISERHHYIPEFFIKGFTDEDGKLYVYNKSKQSIDKQKKSPKQLFFEWNRNSFIVNDKKTDFVEKIHSLGENIYQKTFLKLHNIETNEIEVLDLFNILLFISHTYWRLPNKDDKFIKIVNEINRDNTFFEIRSQDTGKKANNNFYNQIKRKPEFIESYKVIKSIIDYVTINKININNEWKIYYSHKDNDNFCVLGDNPIIINKNDNNNFLENELIFRLSKRIIIMHLRNNKIKTLIPENILKIDILLFLQSQKMVVSSNEKYLEMIALLANNYNTTEKIDKLKTEIFEY